MLRATSELMGERIGAFARTKANPAIAIDQCWAIAGLVDDAFYDDLSTDPAKRADELCAAVFGCTAWGHRAGEFVPAPGYTQTIQESHPEPAAAIDAAWAVADDKAKGEFHATAAGYLDDAKWFYSWSCGEDSWFGGYHTRDEAVAAGLRNRQPEDGSTFFVAHLKQVSVSEHDLEGREVWDGKPPNWDDACKAP